MMDDLPRTTIDIQILPPTRPEDSIHLEELHSALTRESIATEVQRGPGAPGEKSVGPIMALTIVNALCTVLTTVVSVAAALASKRRYTVTVQLGDTTHSISDLSPREYKDLLLRLHHTKPGALSVRLKRRAEPH